MNEKVGKIAQVVNSRKFSKNSEFQHPTPVGRSLTGHEVLYCLRIIHVGNSENINIYQFFIHFILFIYSCNFFQFYSSLLDFVYFISFIYFYPSSPISSICTHVYPISPDKSISCIKHKDDQQDRTLPLITNLTHMICSCEYQFLL